VGKQLRFIRWLIPPWEMPSDPVKAVFWFLRWFLQVLVHFFWLPILIGAIFFAYSDWSSAWNGIVSGTITLLIGIALWVVLYLVLLVVNVGTKVSQVLSEVKRVQQDFSSPRSPYFFNEPEEEGHVIDGTITDIEEERRKRRRE
jgi:uncharacterized membrane protein